MRVRFRLACVILSGLAVQVHCGASVSSITRIAVSGPEFVSFGDGPSINNAGTVAFSGTLTSGVHGIFKVVNGQPFAILASSTMANPPFTIFGDRPSIDKTSDLVAFDAMVPTGRGVYLATAGQVRTIANMDSYSSLTGSVSIRSNGSGVAAFHGSTNAGGEGMFVSDGTFTTVIADANTPLTAFGMNPVINAAGVVAFRATSAASGMGLYTGNGGPVRNLATTSGPYSMFSGSAAINDAGVVAFRANLDTGGQGVYIISGGVTTLIADSSGPYMVFNVPAINNHGTVAFRASLDAGGAGLFTGPNPRTDKVIAIGDALDGSVVTDVSIFIGALNDARQIVFQANLADGRMGIYRGQFPNPCPADINNTSAVNVDDLLAVINAWGPCVGGTCPADIAPPGGNGIVNVDDLLLVINSWGACP